MTTFQTSSGPQTFNDPGAKLVVTAPPNISELQIDTTRCSFTATVEDSSDLQIDPLACPTYQGVSNAGVMASYTLTFDRGTATYEGTTLTTNQSGTQLGSNYADGTPNQLYDFETTTTASKQ